MSKVTVPFLFVNPKSYLWGKESLELFLKLQPDIVLCDVVMPGISGIQFVAMLRRYSKAPIVMLSNFNEFDKVREAFQYGAS